MIYCEEARRIIHLYIDNELQGIELAQFKTHINSCNNCRIVLEKEQDWLLTLRAQAPLYHAPTPLRDSIEQLVQANVDVEYSQPAPAELRQQITKLVRRHIWATNLSSPWLKIAAAIILLIAIAGLWINIPSKLDRSSAFVLMAVNNHLRRQKGSLPLEITTDSANAVTDWFNGKLVFNLKLPNYEAPPDHPKPYILEGARLVGFENDYAAYIAYRMEGRLISLVVTSANTVQPAGGERIVSQNISFHFQTIDGLKVITWTDNGLTYTLVSDLAERGQASCIVCHQDKQQEIIQPFQSTLPSE
ncbi:MAG: anti-sigma factor [Acidobacteriota bacterium]